MALITQVASPAFLALPREQVNNHKVSCTKPEARLDVSAEIENAALINIDRTDPYRWRLIGLIRTVGAKAAALQ
jgi:hypothetical protein